MTRKALHLVVDLEIQAVTCPGVWLCPSGNVQLLFSMMGQEVQTKKLPPVFPLLFHEKITFQKTFPMAGCLAEVQDALSREDVYAVLLQEVEDPMGSAAVQLARFHSSTLNILYPSPCAKGLLAGVDIDLLMEASKDYPGILCPKIELSTKTVLKEVPTNVTDGYIINPKTLSSKKEAYHQRPNAGGDIKKVHSDRRYRVIPNSHVETDKKIQLRQQLQRNNHGLCRSPSSGPTNRVCQSNLCEHQSNHTFCPGKCALQYAPPCLETCNCGAGHLTSKCSLCTKYKAVFSSNADFCDAPEIRSQCQGTNQRHSLSSSFENTKRFLGCHKRCILMWIAFWNLIWAILYTIEISFLQFLIVLCPSQHSVIKYLDQKRDLTTESSQKKGVNTLICHTLQTRNIIQIHVFK